MVTQKIDQKKSDFLGRNIYDMWHIISPKNAYFGFIN